MNVLLLYDYPPSPGGLATQGALLHQGLHERSVNVHSVHSESEQEKEWYYKWFKPDVVVGIGYWGHIPHLVLHPQQHGIPHPVPWLVANGYMANYHDVLDELPLVLVTSTWVKEVYVRDGVKADPIQVLPVGCNTDVFIPRDRSDPKVVAIRESLGVGPEELMILTVGGDATSKGAQEVMRALAKIDAQVPAWKYVCKVWPQQRTEDQNAADLALAAQLGIDHKVIYSTGVTSRNYMPYLLAACDIYAAPSRLEGFGMIQVEANACGKPVVSIHAMGLLDTMIHGETALLARVAEEIKQQEVILGEESGYTNGYRHVFDQPRTVDFRASVEDVADHLLTLMQNESLREQMGEAGRRHVVEQFDYRVVARKFMDLVSPLMERGKDA
jgi:glycosyltransferase involved in cell wall biosynthesis